MPSSIKSKVKSFEWKTRRENNSDEEILIAYFGGRPQWSGNKLYKIGDLRVEYSGARLYKVGGARIEYSGNKLYRINGERVEWSGDKVYRVGNRRL